MSFKAQDARRLALSMDDETPSVDILLKSAISAIKLSASVGLRTASLTLTPMRIAFARSDMRDLLRTLVLMGYRVKANKYFRLRIDF